MTSWSGSTRDAQRERSRIVSLSPFHRRISLPDELCATGPEGGFVHELIVPFVLPPPTGS